MKEEIDVGVTTDLNDIYAVSCGDNIHNMLAAGHRSMIYYYY